MSSFIVQGGKSYHRDKTYFFFHRTNQNATQQQILLSPSYLSHACLIHVAQPVSSVSSIRASKVWEIRTLKEEVVFMMSVLYTSVSILSQKKNLRDGYSDIKFYISYSNGLFRKHRIIDAAPEISILPFFHECISSAGGIQVSSWQQMER